MSTVYAYHNGKVCLALNALIESEYEGLKPTVRKDGRVFYELWGKWRRQAKRMGGFTRPGGNGRTSLIEFDYIPARYREEIIALYGDPKRKAASSSFANRIEKDPNAATFYLEYRLDDGRDLPQKHIKLYTANACILNALRDAYRTRALARAKHGKGNTGFWKQAAKVLQDLKAEMPHSLPKNPTSLRRKYDEYIKVGYEALISGKFCNDNTAKITPEIEAWLIKEMAGTRQSVDMVYMRYHAEAERQGWRTDITQAAFRARASEPRVQQLIDYKRHGRKLLQNKKGYTFRLKKATYSNDIWVGDGTMLNWYYRADNGKLATATTYFVMDGASSKFLGWSTEEGINKENRAMQMAAYRMAVRNAGAKPYQLLYDNQGGHKGHTASAFYSMLATVAFPTRAYRPSGKPIEQAFKRFQQLKLSEFPFWSGFGRESWSNASYKPNMEAIQANIEHLPNYEQLLQLLDVVIDEWNTLAYRDIPAPNAAYEQKRDPQEEPITLEELTDLFWNVSNKPVKYTPQGFRFERGGEIKWYEVYNAEGDVDFAFRRNYLGQRFYFRYDPDWEYTDIDLLQEHPTGGWQRVATASPKREVHRSARDLEAGEREWIDRQLAAQEAEMDLMDDTLEAIGYRDDEAYSAWQKKLDNKVPVMANDEDEDDPDKLFLKRM